MIDPDCRLCSGFGWVPVGSTEAGSWYERDWRLMLDPAQDWQACPRCGETGDWARLHDDLARVMMRRLDQEVGDWSADGPWRVGVVDDFRRVYRWRDLACVCSRVDPRHWTVLSTGGVCHDLDDHRCRLLLREAGAPPLRVLDG